MDLLTVAFAHAYAPISCNKRMTVAIGPARAIACRDTVLGGESPWISASRKKGHRLRIEPGLGKGCALALAEAGCDLVVNGRDAKTLPQTAAEIRERFGVAVDRNRRRCSPTRRSRRNCSPPAPARTSWSTTMAARPFATFSELDREAILEGVTNNMVAPLELIQAVIGGMAERGFGRIVNITSLSVYVPIPGLDLSSARGPA